MRPSPTHDQLIELGRLLRSSREQRGLSLRALAQAAGVSASYLASIETARNPATGRPGLPSLTVLSAVASALDLDVSALMRTIAASPHTAEGGRHALLYVLGERPASALEHVLRTYGDMADRWVYIPDPREDAGVAASDPAALGLRCDWPPGRDPYADRRLVPARIVGALETALGRSRHHLRGAGRLGIAIADCSAVMGWVLNPEAEIEFESTWPAAVDRVFVESVGRVPTANVCVYHHADIEALGRADTLGMAVALLREHSTVSALNCDGTLRTGAAAAEAILRRFRPAGVTDGAWRALAAAAAGGLHP
jgi:transcriptional regulator with XRE-family HTH domain